jgi:cytochrome P450
VHLGRRSNHPSSAAPHADAHENARAGADDDKKRGGSDGGEDEEEEEFDYAFPSLRALANLPVLNAVITETMRLYPIVPARLPRVAPAGGAFVDGVWVPDGTDVSVQPFTLQRTASVFPAPDTWDPARWFIRTSLVSGGGGSSSDGSGGGGGGVVSEIQAALDEAGSGFGDGVSHEGIGDDMAATTTTGKTADAAICADGSESMRAHMLPFSKGLRTCIGRGIALAEMRLALAVIAQRFGRVRMRDARQVEADMRITDFSLLIPRGHRCMLIFE